MHSPLLIPDCTRFLAHIHLLDTRDHRSASSCLFRESAQVHSMLFGNLVRRSQRQNRCRQQNGFRCHCSGPLILDVTRQRYQVFALGYFVFTSRSTSSRLAETSCRYQQPELNLHSRQSAHRGRGDVRRVNWTMALALVWFWQRNNSGHFGSGEGAKPCFGAGTRLLARHACAGLRLLQAWLKTRRQN